MKNLIEFKDLPNIYGVKVPLEIEYKSAYYVNDNQTLIFNSDFILANTLLILDGEWKL